MESIEYRRYCENTVINAILCAWIPRAEKAGCQVRVSVELPESLFVEVLDLCIILSNAMENAIHACEEVEETGRYIQLKVYIKNEKQIQIYIVNSCKEEVLFNKKGLPEKKHAKGHGIGLPSIYGVAEKYRGVVLCECKDHAFSLKAVLFKPTGERVQIQEEKRRRSLWFFSAFCMYNHGNTDKLSTLLLEFTLTSRFRLLFTPYRGLFISFSFAYFSDNACSCALLFKPS